MEDGMQDINRNRVFKNGVDEKNMLNCSHKASRYIRIACSVRRLTYKSIVNPLKLCLSGVSACEKPGLTVRLFFVEDIPYIVYICENLSICCMVGR